MRVQNPDGEWKDYPPSFFLRDRIKFESFVEEHNRTSRMRDLTVDDTDVLCVRHDVDHDLGHALKFAKWEYELGVHSTYFVLHTAYYYRDKDKLYDQMKSLVDMDHEVGLHIDSVNATSGFRNTPNYSAAADLLKLELAQLRVMGFDMVGSAAHGGHRSDLELFTNGFTLEDFGLQYEAYDLQRQLKVNYISDNQGSWQSPIVKKPGQITVMSIHPEHWYLK
jgi:hypothetical protein